MRETISAENVFNYLKKKIWVLVIFAAVFAVIGGSVKLYEDRQTNFEQTEEEDFYQYNIGVLLDIPENLTSEELDYFNTFKIPRFIQAMSSDAKINELYEEFKDSFVTVDSLSRNANTNKEIFERAFAVNNYDDIVSDNTFPSLYKVYDKNLVVISCVARGEGIARQIVSRYLELVLPEARQILDGLTITVGDSSEYIYENGTYAYTTVNIPTSPSIILFALLGLLIGIIVLLIVYNYSQLVKNESILRANFPEIPVLAHFSKRGTKDECAKANLEQSLKNSGITDFIVTSVSPKENVKVLNEFNNLKFLSYAEHTRELYEEAEKSQGVAVAVFENETKLNLLEESLYHLNENKVKVIGFLLFNT